MKQKKSDPFSKLLDAIEINGGTSALLVTPQS